MRSFILACLCLLLSLSPPAEAQRPGALDVVLKPRASKGVVSGLEVTLRFQALPVAEGETLLRMPTTIVSTPTAAYAAEAIDVRDRRGPVPLTAVDEPPTPSGVYRSYRAGRATQGRVTVRYTAPVREVTAQTRGGPLFDFRVQPGGAIGSGMYIFALPEGDRAYAMRLRWDLSELGRGARGIWSYGEGSVAHEGPASDLNTTFYAMGNVRSEPATGGDFGVYWFGDTPFDVRVLAVDIRTVFNYMANFFRDEEGAPYRVFVRQNVHPGGGGTALSRSFMFGYSVVNPDAGGNLQGLLAHEMAHTWPRFNDDDPHGLTAWYTEGNAEYYSLRLLLRSGVISVDDFIERMNTRAEAYYSNPHLRLTNEAAGEIFWSDSRAQRVPYGRGLMYLVGVDAAVRAASSGVRSLDDLVLEVNDRQARGDVIGLTQWSEIVQRELGAPGSAALDAMAAGEVITPPANSLGPCFRPVQGELRAFQLGFDRLRLGVVSSLEAGSAAEAAGLRNGDLIVEHTPLDQLEADPAKRMEMVIERGGAPQRISFLPRGAPVRAWQWQRVPGVEDAACRL